MGTLIPIVRGGVASGEKVELGLFVIPAGPFAVCFSSLEKSQVRLLAFLIEADGLQTAKEQVGGHQIKVETEWVHHLHEGVHEFALKFFIILALAQGIVHDFEET